MKGIWPINVLLTALHHLGKSKVKIQVTLACFGNQETGCVVLSATGRCYRLCAGSNRHRARALQLEITDVTEKI